MTNTQLSLVIGVPVVCNGLANVMLYVLLTKRLDEMQMAITKHLDNLQRTLA